MPERGPDSLSLVVFAGEFEKVHYALAMAAAAAALGKPVTMLFTMGACRALAAEAGWRALPAEGGRSGGEADDALAAKGIGGFEELLAACVAMGVRVLACEMGLRAIGLDRASLRDDVPIQEGGLATFFQDASPRGAMLFV